ncbi:hypothetical protein IFM89_007944 [Coptis chinensis]|uniref:Uncharacterized protein n=1 Tax=Coptis chinensis TaxID=261450 RepID=A0A835IN55_9MAGN|nr:hypothetical protein IFM89_007944 [Coptis chinensis]
MVFFVFRNDWDTLKRLLSFRLKQLLIRKTIPTRVKGKLLIDGTGGPPQTWVQKATSVNPHINNTNQFSALAELQEEEDGNKDGEQNALIVVVDEHITTSQEVQLAPEGDEEINLEAVVIADSDDQNKRGNTEGQLSDSTDSTDTEEDYSGAEFEEEFSDALNVQTELNTVENMERQANSESPKQREDAPQTPASCASSASVVRCTPSRLQQLINEATEVIQAIDHPAQAQRIRERERLPYRSTFSPLFKSWLCLSFFNSYSFRYMGHPNGKVARASHLVFVAFIASRKDSNMDDRVLLKEQLVYYYMQRALEGYPGITPFEVEQWKRVLICGKIGKETLSPVLPNLMKLLAQFTLQLPKDGQKMVLDEIHTLVAESDDVTRKPTLVSWVQSLSFLCSQTTSSTMARKFKRDEASVGSTDNLSLNRISARL